MNEAHDRPFPPPSQGRVGWPWTSNDGVTPLAPQSPDPTLPRVTVITASFNQGEYLEEAIRSVVLQDHRNLEYLVIDGGSTDGSVAIIERYEPWIAAWVSEQDNGQADAINRGFDQASGNYLCWLNADDILYQGFLSRRVGEFATRPDTDLIYGDIDTGWTGEEKQILRGGPPVFNDMLRTLDVAVPQQGAMWRRSTVERLGGLDPRWHVVLDREFFLRIIGRGNATYIPGRCGFFRQHPEAKSIAEATAWVAELPSMYAELFADPSLDPAAKSLERETMAMVHLLCSDILRAAGDWSGTSRHLLLALGWKPGHAFTRFVGARIHGLRRRFLRPASRKKSVQTPVP